MSGLSAGERLHRARRIGTTFGRVYLGIRTHRFLAKHVRPADMAERWSRQNRQSAEAIYETAIELRGLILKGCQFLGGRADVLPREYVEVLSRLQDRVPPHGFDVVRERVEAELGRPLEEIFRDFEPEPIASASLAQVHRAVRHDGRVVAVKVQYPEIEALVRGDLRNLRTLFRAAGLLERDFDLMPLIDELATEMPRELDFANEGRNAETIGAYFADREDIGVPAIHWDLSTRRVLVMEFIEGIKVSDVSALRAAGLDTDRVAQILIDAYCEQLLVRGFFHADPHPGNLLVQRDDNGEPRLVFLDFGLAKKLPARFRHAVLEFAGALLQGNADAMGKALLELGFETRDGSAETLSEMARFVLYAAQEMRAQRHVDRELAERIRSELPDQIRQNPLVRVPTHLVLVGRVIGLLSGLARTLETRIDLVATILPYALRPEKPEP